jgi:regulator of sigma E protease
VAFLLIWIVGVSQGEGVYSTVVESVGTGTPAAAAGVQPGDRIVKIDGSTIGSWDDVRTQIVINPGKTVVVVVERAGVLTELKATMDELEDGTGYFGVSPIYDHRDLGFASGFGYAGRTTGSMVALIFKGIGMMFKGDVPVTGDQGLAGPVGIIQISSQAFEGGYYLNLLALISVNLAILNMLPLLPLDGGHVLFSVIERIRGKSISLRLFEQISTVGLVLFVLLFFVAMYNDVGRLIPG